MNKQVLFLSVVILLLTIAAPATLAQADCDFSISNYARAVQLHDMGDYGRALQHYDCALLEDPDDPVIPILIDNVYEDIQSAGRAWESPKQPLCDPARNHGELGAAAFERGESRQAQTHLHCALLVDPADVTALTLMGRIHANLGDAHSAKHYLDRAELARAADAGQAVAAKSPADFVMPDWLRPYETAPRTVGGKTGAANLNRALSPAAYAKPIFVVRIAARITVQATDAAPDAREWVTDAANEVSPAPAERRVRCEPGQQDGWSWVMSEPLC